MSSLKDDIIFNLIEKMEEDFNESPRSPASSVHKTANLLPQKKNFSKASLANGKA